MATTGGDEVQPERELIRWRRSSRCESGACAEVAVIGESVALRRSSQPDVTISYTNDEWNTFLARAEVGEFHCKEVVVIDETVMLRHMSQPDVTISFTNDEWNAFLAGAKGGEFAVDGPTAAA